MPINPDLLIAAPILQDYFSDKDGTAMAAGTITCYQDNSRTTLKNWYYQSGTPGNYTYIRLPNPLTLSAAGTICDVNGVDTIPFWYPYSELDETQKQPYYVTIVNYAQTNEITRANFPFNPGTGGAGGNDTSVENYIINNVFWRNVGTVNLTDILNMTVSPSQHDGFQYPDIQFIKNVTGGQDTLTFTKFPLSNEQILTGDITPEYYINHVCSNNATGETQKCYQFPISLHINTLNAVQYTCTIQAQNAGGTAPGQDTVNLFILQDTGAGTTAPAPFLIGSITLNPMWTKYEFTTTFPNTAGLTLGNGGDDALYLQVQMPLDISCSINFTKPSIYLTQDAPTNSFATYDQIDSIIDSPRTGDIRTSLNNFYPYGWAPMNNGTIGNASSNATSRANQDCWKLFNLLWNHFSAYTSGTTNLLAQMVTSTGTNVAYGASAIADFNANNAITLTKTMGQVILGTAPVSSYISSYGTTMTVTSNVVTTSHNVNYFNGMPIYFTGTTTLSLNTIYYVSGFNGTNAFHVSTTFANAIAGTTVTVASDSGSVFSSLAGTSEGEYAHTQLISELVSHNHPGSTYGNNSSASGGSVTSYGSSSPSNQNFPVNVAAQGGGAAFNVTQPGSFLNMFIKL